MLHKCIVLYKNNKAHRKAITLKKVVLAIILLFFVKYSFLYSNTHINKIVGWKNITMSERDQY